MKARYSILSFLLFCLIDLSAQSILYEHYSSKDGLSSNTVYGLFQDRQGYLWIGTDNGLCRYNGTDFIKVAGKENVAFTDIYDFFEADDGTLWMSGAGCRLYFLHNDSIKPYRYNHRIESLSPASYHFSDFSVTNSQQVVFSIHGTGTYEIDSIGQMKPWSNTDLELVGYGKTYFLATPTSRKMQPGEQREVSFKKTPLHKPNYHSLRLPTAGNYHRIQTLKSSSIPAFSVGTDFFYIQGGSLKVKTMSRTINDHTMGPNGEVIFGLSHNGLMRLNVVTGEMHHLIPALSNENVNAVQFDGYGNCWVGTENHGLYAIPPLRVEQLDSVHSRGNRRVARIRVHENKVFIGLSDGYICQLDSSGSVIRNWDLSKKSRSRWLHDFIVLDSGEILAKMGNEHYHVMNSHELRFNTAKVDLRRFLQTQRGHYGRSSTHLLRLGTSLSDPPMVPRAFQTQDSHKNLIFHEFYPYKDNEWILSNREFLYITHKDSAHLAHKTFGLPERSYVTSMAKLGPHYLFGTRNQGLILSTEEGVWNINVEDGLSDVGITTLLLLSDTTLMVGTRNGADLITLYDPDAHRFSVRSILSDHHVTDLKAGSGQLWIGSKSGLFRVGPIDMRIQEPVPSLRIVDIRGGTKKLDPFTSNTELSWSDRDITFHFEGIDITANGSILYTYRLRGYDDAWRTSNNGRIHYPALEPREYTLEVKASNKHRLESQVLYIPFRICPPFFRTWWFITLCALLLLASTHWYIRWSKSKALKKWEQQNHMALLTQKAISFRMQPHFLFNSLNSLDYFIATGDNEKASEYLHEFTRLMRSNVEYSNNDLIALEHEVVLLRSYCAMAKMRLKGGFELNFQVEEGIDQENTCIPSMTLQPIIENAIWHGLRPLASNRKLTILVRKHRKRLIILIEDNGIGIRQQIRNNAKDANLRNKHALQLIDKRLKLFSNIHGAPFCLELTNLSENSESHGTRCSLEFPLILKSNSPTNA